MEKLNIFILTLLVSMSEFGVVTPNPLPYSTDSEEANRDWYNDPEIFEYGKSIQTDFETTESIRKSEIVTKEPKDSIVQEEHISDLSDFAKWLVNPDNSNAKSFRVLLAKAWELIKDVPWKESDGVTTTTERDLDNIVLKTMEEDGETSTQLTLDLHSAIKVIDNDEEYEYNPYALNDLE